VVEWDGGWGIKLDRDGIVENCMREGRGEMEEEIEKERRRGGKSLWFLVLARRLLHQHHHLWTDGKEEGNKHVA